MLWLLDLVCNGWKQLFLTSYVLEVQVRDVLPTSTEGIPRTRSADLLTESLWNAAEARDELHKFVKQSGPDACMQQGEQAGVG